MNFYQLLTLLTGILCFVIGTYLFIRHEGSQFHKTYACGIVVAGLYVLFLFGFNIAQSQDEAWIWLRLSAIVHFIPAINLHAILIFSISFQKFSTRRKLLSVYSPFISFVILDFFFPEATYQSPVLTAGGWNSVFNNDSILQLANMSIYLLCLALQIFLLAEILLRSPDQVKRRFALFGFFTYIVPMLAAFFLTFVFTYIDPEILRIETLFVLFACLSTIFCLYRFNIFDVSIEIVAKDVVHKMSNFLVLLNEKRMIAFINPKAQELLGYRSDELKGKYIDQVISKTDCNTLFTEKLDHYTVELFMQPKSRRSFPAMVSIACVEKKNSLLGYIIIGNDLTKMYSLREEKKIAELELKALLRQMNPHFLFNSLNTVQFYISRNDEEKANEYLSQFSVLMRNILEASEKNSIGLQEEIDTIALYLQMEATRFAGKFSYTIHVDPGVHQAEIKIPPMIIQPFIENAIWHGLLPKSSDRILTIHFTINDPYLTCVIRDNGIGRKQSAAINKMMKPHHRSTAIRNIEERVQLINKQLKTAGICIEIEDCIDDFKNPTGTNVEINFPLSFQMA